VQLVVVDLIPALLEWEGRDPLDVPAAVPQARGVLEDLFTDFRLAAVTDADRPASSVRKALERLDLAAYFDSVGTSAGFGPVVSARVVSRIAGALGAAGQTIVVTGRAPLAPDLQRSLIPAVVVEPGGLIHVPAAVRRITGTSLSR
jgi:hypothetical protein